MISFVKKIKRLPQFLVKKKKLIFGTTNYKKFIIIGRSRTGSGLLVDLLNSHPAINAYGEIFIMLNGRTCKEIWRKTFCRKSRSIKYVGFKLFYYHPIDSSDKTVWDYIKADPNIKIIHLKRINMLRTIVSKKIADKTKVWKQKTNENGILKKDKLVELSFNECIDEFNQMRKWERDAEIALEKNDIIQINYEDLVENKENTMKRIFEFLNIPYYAVDSNFQKQNDEPLKDLIVNYDELCHLLNKTEWSYMIENEIS